MDSRICAGFPSNPILSFHHNKQLLISAKVENISLSKWLVKWKLLTKLSLPKMYTNVYVSNLQSKRERHVGKVFFFHDEND